MRKYLSLAILFAGMALAPLAYALASNFAPDLKTVLVYEGGNDDDPNDPGGRTSRGILQREWNVYRRTHPGLPADVWKAPQSAIEDIYRGDYWVVCRGDDMPAGLDLTVFDYCVNSGVGRVPKVLRKLLDMQPGAARITDDVLAAIKKRRPTQLINAVNDERHAFLHSLSTCQYFCKGWDSRVASVRAISLRNAGVATAKLPGYMLKPKMCMTEDGRRCGKAFEENSVPGRFDFEELLGPSPHPFDE